MSVTIQKQEKEFRKDLPDGSVLIVSVRHDDRCGNGHNTFSVVAALFDRDRAIPGEAFTTNSRGRKRWLGSCGCLHGEVARHFPELSTFLKWHLTSTDGPLHYVENTLYHVAQGDLDAARASAVWLDASDREISTATKETLEARLPSLMTAFRRDVESLGLEFYGRNDE